MTPDSASALSLPVRQLESELLSPSLRSIIKSSFIKVVEASEYQPNTSPCPIHEIDYLTDYYAILGLTRSAGREEIQTAHREKVKGLHDDRLGAAAREIREIAFRKYELVSKAYDVLSDPDKKARYDILLATFDPKHISKDGTPILDLGNRLYDLDNLLAGVESPLVGSMHQLLSQEAHYSEDALSFIKDAYAKTENPPDTLVKSYRHMLSSKLAQLDADQYRAWGKVGVINQPEGKRVLVPEDFVTSTKAQLNELKNSFSALIQQRLLSVESGASPLLLTVNNTAETLPEDPLEITELLTTRALANIAPYEAEVVRIAEARSDTLNELMETFPLEYALPLGETLTSLPIFKKFVVILNMSPEGSGPFRCFPFSITESAALNLGTIEEISSLRPDCADVQFALQANVILAPRHPAIPAVMHVFKIASQHAENFLGMSTEEVEN